MTTDTAVPVTDPEPILEPTSPDATSHLARCAECDFMVRYRPSSSGTGFALLDSDRALGIGEHNRPMCPEGHGEMEIADDRLPIEQAIEQTAERLDATKQRLPFPAPPFNYEGALHSLYEKRHDIATLEQRVDDRKESLKRAKDELDDANKELGKMLDQFEQHEQDRVHEIARREAAAAAGNPEETNLVRCIWEEQHPGETCPICSDPELHAVEARDSSAHLDEVAELAELRDVTSVVDALEGAEILIHSAKVRSWSPEQRAAVREWVLAGDGNGPIPPRPDVLGKSHIAGQVVDNQDQCCTQCDEILISGGEGANYYATGLMVGTECKGKPPARYPKGRGKKGAKA